MRAKTLLPLLFIPLLLTRSAGASPYPLAVIMDEKEAETLSGQKIQTTSELLEKAATSKARKALAKATGLAEAKLLQWAQTCDILRIKGVGPEMVRLLAAAKVTTVKQLKAQKPAALLKKVEQANAKEKISENPPNLVQLSNWIEQAGKLKPVLR